MGEFLGILFCGGRGTRLGKITQYISKSFIPIFDQPAFQYGLDMLERSRRIDEIIILSNDDNDNKLQQTGYPTIIQDNNQVSDMFSGWDYIKKVTKTKKHGVLVPSDNISDIKLDDLIDLYLNKNVDLVFSLYKIQDKKKLAQMGCYDPVEKQFFYKSRNPQTDFGVIAPYIANNQLKIHSGDNTLSHKNAAFIEHKGYWFDIGDVDSILEASSFIKKGDYYVDR